MTKFLFVLVLMLTACGSSATDITQASGATGGTSGTGTPTFEATGGATAQGDTSGETSTPATGGTLAATGGAPGLTGGATTATGGAFQGTGGALATGGAPLGTGGSLPAWTTRLIKEVQILVFEKATSVQIQFEDGGSMAAPRAGAGGSCMTGYRAIDVEGQDGSTTSWCIPENFSCTTYLMRQGANESWLEAVCL